MHWDGAVAKLCLRVEGGFVHLMGHKHVHRGDGIQDRKVGLGQERGVGEVNLVLG